MNVCFKYKVKIDVDRICFVLNDSAQQDIANKNLKNSFFIGRIFKTRD